MGASARSEEEVGAMLRRLEHPQMTLQTASKSEEGQPHRAGDVLYNAEIQGSAVDVSSCPAAGVGV